MTIIILELGLVHFIGFHKKIIRFEPNKFVQNSMRIKVLATNLPNVAILFLRNKHRFKVVAKMKSNG
jgi:hypothetical protein